MQKRIHEKLADIKAKSYLCVKSVPAQKVVVKSLHQKQSCQKSVKRPAKVASKAWIMQKPLTGKRHALKRIISKTPQRGKITAKTKRPEKYINEKYG